MAHVAQQGARERRAWREAPTAEALAFDRWRLGSLIGGEPGEARVVRPSAFGLFFDWPSPLRFLGDDGRPLPGCLTDDGIAILTISGPLEHHASWWASYDDIAAQVEAALRYSATRALVLKIDSPGGVVAGMGQAHRAIRRLQRETGKPVIAWVDETACSAAYNIACACSEIWMPPEAQVGSIGVILCTIDESEHLKKEGIAVRYVVSGKRKADMHPGAPITDDVLREAQGKVDQLADAFFAAVARSRGMTPAAVAALEAAVFVGETAVEVGLADGVSDWPAFLGTLRDSLGATVGAPRGTTGGTVARAKDEAMKLTAMQKAAAKTKAEMAVGAAQKAYDKAPTDENFEALTKASNELAKVIHHMKHEEKTVQVDDPDSERPGEPSSKGPDTAKSAKGEDAPESEDPTSSEEARKAKKAKKAKLAEEGAEGEDEEEKKAIAAFSSAQRRYAAKMQGVDAYGVHGPEKLLRACMKATGETTVRGVFGALEGLGARLAAGAKVERTVEKLAEKSRATEIAAIVTDAKHAGKTQGKAHREELRAYGEQHGRTALKALVKMLPVIAKSEPFTAREDDNTARGQFQDGDGQLEAIAEQAAREFSSNADEQKAFKAKFIENMKAQARKIPAA